MRRFNLIMMIAVIAGLLVKVDLAAQTPSATEEATLRALARAAEVNLRETILPFWLRHARDEARGGFFGVVRPNLTVDERAPRGALLSSRILWSFSAAHRESGDAAQRAMARWAWEDLTARFLDPVDGGLFWSIRPGGAPLDSRKHAYGQVFGIFALSEFHRASGEPAALRQAIELYRALERHARDRTHGGYFEELDRNWRRIDDLDRRGRIIGGLGTKSQNTHLHILEAYTHLLRVWPDAQLRDDLRALVEVMLTRVLDPATHHLRLFFDDDWSSLSTEVSFGHDIEFSWLLCETADVLGDAALIARARREALAIADACWREGRDGDGGLCNAAGPDGVLDRSKDWWSQAEAAVGFLNAWQLSREPRYLEAAQETWNFIDQHLVNRETGEWFQSVDAAGRPDRRSALASLWKCPYHNSRACLETMARVRAELGRASRERPGGLSPARGGTR